jgi:hypothetical protein
MRSTVLVSCDGGAIWSALGGFHNLAESREKVAEGTDWKQITVFAGFPYAVAGRGTHVVASTSHGPHLSADGGRTFRLMGIGASDEELRVLALDGTRIYAGVSQGGFWRMDPALPVPTSIDRGAPARPNAGSGRLRPPRASGTIGRVFNGNQFTFGRPGARIFVQADGRLVPVSVHSHPW